MSNAIAQAASPSSPTLRYDEMCRAIARAYAVDEAKTLMDQATAIEVYAHQSQNIEAERQACEIRMRATRATRATAGSAREGERRGATRRRAQRQGRNDVAADDTVSRPRDNARSVLALSEARGRARASVRGRPCRAWPRDHGRHHRGAERADSQCRGRSRAVAVGQAERPSAKNCSLLIQMIWSRRCHRTCRPPLGISRRGSRRGCRGSSHERRRRRTV